MAVLHPKAALVPGPSRQPKPDAGDDDLPSFGSFGGGLSTAGTEDAGKAPGRPAAPVSFGEWVRRAGAQGADVVGGEGPPAAKASDEGSGTWDAGKRRDGAGDAKERRAELASAGSRVGEPRGPLPEQKEGPSRAPRQALPSLESEALRLCNVHGLVIANERRSVHLIRRNFTDQDELGSGKFNKVYRWVDAKRNERVFKPLANEERGWVASRTGIERDRPRTANRNLATLDYAKRLGWDVIPGTQVAVARVDGVPRLGLLMDKALGQLARDATRETRMHPEVIRETTKLQLLDHLTGQGDRHAGNYLVHVDAEGRAKVTGVDNDQCFGRLLKDAAGIKRDGKDGRGFRGTGLPPVIDSAMAKAILDLSDEGLEALLKDNLTKDEIGAAKDRLAGVKQHIEALGRMPGRIVPADKWNEVIAGYVVPPPGSGLREPFDSDNSYAARDSRR